MAKKIYSHSKLSSFEQCKLKFKYHYIDKIIPETEKSIESHLGDSVHLTLEWIYTQVKDNKKVPILDEVIVYYSDTWEKNYLSEMVIVNDNLSAKDYYNKGIQFLIDYYVKHQPFDDGTIALEKEIRVSIDEAGEYEIVGFIDRLVQNLQTGEYEIHDYKTANSLPSQEKIDNDRQLALYAIAIKEHFGKDKEVRLVWHYLAHNQKIQSKRTNEQLDLLKQETINLIKQIESTTEFTPNKSRLCDWCEYQQMCLAWQGENEKNTKQEKIDLNKYPVASKYIKG